MSAVCSGIRTYLLTITGVTNLVGTRIRPDALIENETWPAIVLTETSTEHIHTLNRSAGFAESDIDVACFSDTRLEAESVAEAVRDAMQGYIGAAGSETIKSCRLDSRNSVYLTPDDGSDAGIYMTSLSFRVVVTESIPTP
jgi:hypothetical protein